VSTTTVLVWYSTIRLRWFSLAVLDQSAGRVLSSEIRCFLTIRLCYCFALRLID
jgi:hypothetical protein